MKIVAAGKSFWQSPWETDLGADSRQDGWTRVEKDLNILKIKKWEIVVKSIDAWRKFLEKAIALSGLSSH
ncbi:hypothetical protein TNCV_2880041 [Trichonephila clavipes]|uniref:Uncharacterized protein n=1 Tax=Trichonephila clavipes TaxID=2585209 RepID=A0A8X6W2F9_TRICX|nr:hypothetical protein TNCV_2880041 [Trichonephila clavipes]